LLEDEDETLRRVYAHLARALPRTAAPRGARGRRARAEDAAMMAGERAAELAAVGKLIEEAASSTPALHAATKTLLEVVLSAARSPPATPRRARAGGSFRRAHDAQPLEEEDRRRPSGRYGTAQRVRRSAHAGRRTSQRRQSERGGRLSLRSANDSGFKFNFEQAARGRSGPEWRAVLLLNT
jgi:hypothetical protein